MIERKENFPEPGVFPLNGKTGESPYLRWIRIHANYLTVGGVVETLSSIASYGLGVLSNAMVLTPVLLVLSLLLGTLHFRILDNPFLAILLPVAVFYCSAFWRKLDRETKLPNSLKSAAMERLFGERAFGWGVLGFFVGFSVLVVTYLVELLQSYFRVITFTWEGVFLGASALVAAVTSLQRILPAQRNPNRQVLLGMFGLTGFLLLVFVLTLLVNFVTYGNPLELLPYWLWTVTFPERWVVVITLVLLLAMALLYLSSARPENMQGLLIWLGIVLAPIGVLLFTVDKEDGFSKKLDQMRIELGNISRPLAAIVSKPFKPEELGNRSRLVLSLQEETKALNDFVELQPSDADLRAKQVWQSRYFAMAFGYIDRGQELAEGTVLENARFLQILSRMDREGLLKLAEESSSGKLAWKAGDQGQRPKTISDRCQDEVVRQVSVRMMQQMIMLDPPSNEGLERRIKVVLSEAFQKEVLERLKNEYPNARHQSEYAKIVGREGELPTLNITLRQTSSALGTIPFVQRTAEFEKYRAEIEDAIFQVFLAACSPDMLRKCEVLPLSSDERTRINDYMKRESIARRYRNAPVKEVMGHASSQGVPELEFNAHLARKELIDRALDPTNKDMKEALKSLSELSIPTIPSNLDEQTRLRFYTTRPVSIFGTDELVRVAMAKFCVGMHKSELFLPADRVVLVIASGEFGDLQQIGVVRRRLSELVLPVKQRIFLTLASLFAFFVFVGININATSIHGYYRDRLSRTFLIRKSGELVEPESDIKLSELNLPGSVAPYQIINTAVNLQASRDLELRDRRSDFFFLSKLYCGSARTGYVDTVTFEDAYPKLHLNTAMAISAGAVCPNMGQMTNGFIVMVLTVLNIRLGYWLPNPRHLSRPPKNFDKVFEDELNEQVVPRWRTLYGLNSGRLHCESSPTARNQLVGLSFSGGGIRSAAINAGIVQILDRYGIFNHVDYLSTVSGGGYTGACISCLMRYSKEGEGQQVRVAEHVTRQWILPPYYIAAEMFSILRETNAWVNLSDGGHIENLGVFELLRRRCKFVIVGDGEADPKYQFNSLGSLIRIARLEMGVEIDLPLSQFRNLPGDAAMVSDQNATCRSHFGLGKIRYPATESSAEEIGYMLYMKSSMTGDEGELINEYKSRNPSFPHESTTDQFFDIGQFEAYRSLGEHIASSAIEAIGRCMLGSFANKDLTDFEVFAAALSYLVETRCPQV